MATHAVDAVVAQLTNAGLTLALAPAGGLAVAPSSQLKADLRAVIRSNKALLIDWLTAANDPEIDATDPPYTAPDWKELASAYYAHHFSCPICIAAGRGHQYGQRCAIGISLWRPYSESAAVGLNRST